MTTEAPESRQARSSRTGGRVGEGQGLLDLRPTGDVYREDGRPDDGHDARARVIEGVRAGRAVHYIDDRVVGQPVVCKSIRTVTASCRPTFAIPTSATPIRGGTSGRIDARTGKTMEMLTQEFRTARPRESRVARWGDGRRKEVDVAVAPPTLAPPARLSTLRGLKDL